jgi:hypothetical protein
MRRDGDLLVMPGADERWHVARWHGQNGPVSVLDCRDEHAAHQAMDYMVRLREEAAAMLAIDRRIAARLDPNERLLRAVA